MRIEKLILERYGKFTDRELSFDPQASLHVVLGGNEAGKTSALSAIGDLLFGFGGRTDYDFLHESKTLRLGGAFRHSGGRLIEARRRKGNKNTLIDANDQPLPDDLLSPLLGGMTRETFASEFGLTAETLRKGGEELVQASGRLAETLAASSAAMTALSRFKDKLREEADELFTPRRSGSKPFYLAADRRQEADKALRDAIVTREALKQLQDAVGEAHARLEALNAEHAQSGVTLARWQRTLRVRSRLARLDAIASKLSALSELPDVSAQMLADWQAALATDNDLARELFGLDAADAADAQAIAALAVDDALLSEGGVIDALRERLGAVRKEIEDLPRRRQARDGAQDQLNEAARRLGLASYMALLERLPTDPALAQVKDLIERWKRADEALTAAEAKRLRAIQERDAFDSQQGPAQPFIDADELRQRFSALGDVPGQLERLRRERAALKIETDDIEAQVAALDPSPGPVAAIRALPLPDAATIGEHQRVAEAIGNEIKRLGEALRSGDNGIAAIEAELARLSRAGAVPTRADLQEARRQRDLSLEFLRAAIDGDRQLRDAQLSEVVRSSQAIDNVTDQLLSDTERATRFEDAQQRLNEAQQERGRIILQVQSQQAQLTEAKAAWLQCWAASGITPRSTSEMLRWRESVEAIRVRLGKLDAQGANVRALAEECEAGRGAVIAFLERVGRAADASLSAEVLFREAKARFDELQDAWTEAKARSLAKRQIEREISEADEARDRAMRSLDELRLVWPAAMSGIGLSDDATLAQAAAALEVWHAVAVPMTTFKREGRSVETMEADLAAFDRDVFGVAGRVAPSLTMESAQETLALLLKRLEETRRAADQCSRLKEAGLERAARRSALAAKRSANAQVLDAACGSLRLHEASGLAVTLEQLATRQTLVGERTALQQELQEIGDGRDEATLRQEQEGHDLDLLPGEIEREALRQKQLLADIAEASAMLHQKESDLVTLMKGRDAARAAREREEANAELLSIAERWLLRQAASRLATRAIERHRALVQDPLILRASTLFAAATGDAFAGLVIDYGSDDQPVLKAQRLTGERVEVGGLSEGTRDQLFLALRLALLEQRTMEPVPFIGDDLLTSFDERRTLATLRLLAAAGEGRQIILFTHHRHVSELAGSLKDRKVDLIDL